MSVWKATNPAEIQLRAQPSLFWVAFFFAFDGLPSSVDLRFVQLWKREHLQIRASFTQNIEAFFRGIFV